MLIITFLSDTDNYYTLNPLFMKKDGKWKILIDSVSMSDKKSDIIINMPSSLYEKIFEYAIDNSNKDLMLEMIKLGVDINKKDFGSTPPVFCYLL